MNRITISPLKIPAVEFGSSKESKRGLICIQEWWGVNSGILAHAEKLSNDFDAYVVVPDLYKGKIGVDKEEASHLMNEMDFMNAAKEIGEVAKYMKETKNVEKVGTIGFCMGGALSLLGGCTSDDVDACVVFYGVPSGFDVEANVKKPVLANFGELDNLEGFSSKKDATELEEKLKKCPASGDCEVILYPGVGHAFMNAKPDPYESFEAREKSQGFAPYDETQANEAWKNVKTFFEKYV
ncbi:unnamed protein product [Bathycoccus prasinos]